MNRSIVARTQEDVFEEVGFRVYRQRDSPGYTDIPGGTGTRCDGKVGAFVGRVMSSEKTWAWVSWGPEKTMIRDKRISLVTVHGLGSD